ncbi:DNA-binding transcriptional regulator, MarR family [Peptostreptococcaceae bacterium pGA-8]|nr:DNA-binding transcriptional regulator, MarR family [Peptostreptococcaceae bacterium pGA-8]
MSTEKTRETLNELLVKLFNYILYIEERNLKAKGISLTMSEVHLLENVRNAKNNNMSSIAANMMITKGTLSVNSVKLIKKGYLEKYKDEGDKRISRIKITDKALDVLAIHDEFHEELIDKAVEGLNPRDAEIFNNSIESILLYFRRLYRNHYIQDDLK